MVQDPVLKNNKIINTAGQLEIIYFTDPLCCWSWASEPHLEKIRSEFSNISWRYCMGGLIPDWKNYYDELNSVSKPLQMGPVWMHAQHVSGMPMNTLQWVKDPPSSSYPSCIAVKSAFLQGEKIGERYLRLVREAVMLEGRNISRQKVLSDVAMKVKEEFPDFDHKLFLKHLTGEEGIDAFRKDMNEIKIKNIKRFPTFLIRSTEHKGLLITGYRPFEIFAEAIRKISGSFN